MKQSFESLQEADKEKKIALIMKIFQLDRINAITFLRDAFKYWPDASEPTTPPDRATMACSRCGEQMTQVFKCFRCPPIDTPGL